MMYSSMMPQPTVDSIQVADDNDRDDRHDNDRMVVFLV